MAWGKDGVKGAPRKVWSYGLFMEEKEMEVKWRVIVESEKREEKVEEKASR